MSMHYLKEPYEFEEAWVSDVGVCDGRRLTWTRVENENLHKHVHPDLGKNPIFVLECIETNRTLISRIVVDTWQSSRLTVYVEMKDQKQLDEQFVMMICMMHRMRFKVKKDEKAWLKDEDWDKLDKFNKVAGGALGVAGG